jgi:alpha-1,2-mannosyltransferase
MMAATVFFHAGRARAWGKLFAIGMLLILLAHYVKILTPALSDPMARPETSDYDAFWSGGRLALQGTPQLAYDGMQLRAKELTATQIPPGKMLPYMYPPTFELLCLPFAVLPYVASLFVFELLFSAIAAACIMTLLPPRWPLLPVLGFPGLVMNFIIGQNGSISASLFGAASLFLDQRPMLAGAILGGFACKPHLAVALPVALGAARRWRAFAACGLSAWAFTATSVLVLGVAPWGALLKTLWLSSVVLKDPDIDSKLVTVYGAVRLLHGGVTLALAAQALSAVLCLALVAVACRGRPGAGAEIALASMAGLLTIPYAMDYDLFILALPLAWLARQGAAQGWWRGEKLLLVACYVLPLVARSTNLRFGLPLAPFLLAALFALTLARAVRGCKPAFAISERRASTGLPGSATPAWPDGPATSLAGHGEPGNDMTQTPVPQGS